MAESVDTVADEDRSGIDGINVASQIKFDISDDSGSLNGNRDTGTGTRRRRGRRSRAEIEADEAAGIRPQTSKVIGTRGIQRKVIDASRLIQKKLGGQTYQPDVNGNLVPTDIWTIDYDEADLIVNAINGFRSQAPEIPSKWMLPLSAAWLGGVVLFTFGTRLSTWNGWKQAMQAQMAQQQQQQTAQAAYNPPVNSQNGHVPAESMAVAAAMGTTPDAFGPPINEVGY